MKRWSVITAGALAFAVTAGTGAAGAITLQEGIAIVSAQGWERLIADREATASRASAKEARSPRLPRVETSLGHRLLKDAPEAVFAAGTAPVAESSSTTFGVGVSQLVSDFGVTRAAIRGADEAALATEERIRQATNLAARDFVLAYLTLLEAERLVDVAAEEVRRFEAHLGDVNALHEQGEVTVNDVLLIEVSLADARKRSADARRMREISAARMNFLLRLPLTGDVETAEVEAGAAATVPTPEEAFALAERNRSEIVVIDHLLAGGAARVEAERARTRPTLSVGGGYSYEENRYLDPEGNWSVGAALSWTIFDGGARKASLERAEAELDVLALERGMLLESVRLEVRSALVTLATAGESVAVGEKAVEQARESLRLQKAMYEEGEGTSTDVADAVTRLARAEQNYWTAQYAQRRAEALLHYAAGGDMASLYGPPGAPVEGEPHAGAPNVKGD